MERDGVSIRNYVSELVQTLYPNAKKSFSGGTNGTYSVVLGDENFVYKAFYENPGYNGIKTTRDSFKREMYNTKLLEKYGLVVPRIFDAKKIKTEAGDVYILVKEKIEGENLEDYLEDKNVSIKEKNKAVLKAVDYMLKVHEISPRKAKRHKGLEKLVKDRELIPCWEGEDLSTIIFDPRLSNFVYNPKTDEVYLVDVETITKGNPYQDIGWLLADLSEIAIDNPKLLEIEGLAMAKFLLKHPSKSLEAAVKKIKQFKGNYFKMPRESNLEAYKEPKGISVYVSPEEIEALNPKRAEEDMLKANGIKISVPREEARINPNNIDYTQLPDGMLRDVIEALA